MASDDGSSLLGIPGAWISKELNLDLSPPGSLTPSSSIESAYIRPSLKESPTLPSCCDPLPPPSTPIVVHSTPRATNPTLGSCRSDPRVKTASTLMPVGSTPQSIPSLFDGASNISSALLPSPMGIPPFPLPGEPVEMLTRDTTSAHFGATELSFGPSGSLLPKHNSDLGFSTAQEDLEYEEFSSHDSLNYSVTDAFPSLASIDLIPSVPPLAPNLHLQNFPIADELPLEPHSVYFSAVEGDLSGSRSEDGPDPVHGASISSGSALELCIPSAEEAHYQICWQENPSPRRPTARIEVQSDIFQMDGQGVMRQESFTYACKSLPYDAGLRPHAYVDNHEYTTHGKHHLEALAEDLYTTEEFTEEDYVMGEPNRPTIFRKIVEGKRVSKLVALSHLKFRKTPRRGPVHSRVSDSQSPTAFSSIDFPNRSPVTANYPDSPNGLPSLSLSSPPPPSPIPKKKNHTLFRMVWPGPRPLSMFVIPKPKVEGKVMPSPKELPMRLPADENPPPLSPHMSPQMRNVQIPETDVHGRSYGPSRVAVPDLSSRSPDLSIFGRKERRAWLTNIRSPRNSPLVA